jgi:hypothetical protein
MKEESSEISLNDLVLVVNIIDTCTERGSFKGNEILTIGNLREKLVQFIKANSPATKDENTEASE